MHHQANPKESHLIVVKRIFRKSTSGACQLLGGKLVYWNAKNNFIPTQYQLADIFTKPLDEPTFKRLIVELDHVEFTFDETTFTTNNEVALLYLSHLKSEYFKIVSDFIFKYCLREAFTKAPNQYVEYLAEFWYTTKTLEDSKIWVSTPTGGIRGEIATVRPWFSSIGYNGEIGAKGTLKKSFLPPRWRLLMAQMIQCLGGKTGGHDQISNKDAIILVCLVNGVVVDFASVHNWALMPNQPEPPFPNHMVAICNADVLVEFKAPKTSSQAEKKCWSPGM
ncbi:hypothetical protein Tco_0451589 [Tanacetum coccineum]